MKSSPWSGFFAAAARGLLALCIVGAPAAAQTPPVTHSLTLKDGQRREGQILGISGGNVQIQITAAGGTGQVQTGVPLRDVQAASMPAPPDVAKAAEAMAAGNAKAAAGLLQPLVTSFMGLPASWVQTAAVLLVDAQIEAGDEKAAEQTLVEFERSYPAATDMTPLLKAKLAVARNNYAGAKPLLQPIVQQGEQTRLSDTSKGVTFGQAFYLMGRIREAEGNYPEALQDYLRTSAIFFQDAATAARAQARADALIQEKNVVVP